MAEDIPSRRLTTIVALDVAGYSARTEADEAIVFVPSCARLGLVEFWSATGKWPDCADEVPYDFRSACESARDIPTKEFGF